MSSHEKKRFERVVAILLQLQIRRSVTAGALAKRFAVSIRTIYRDVRTLEGAGLPIVSTVGKGYSLMEDYHLPPVMLTRPEAISFVTAEKKS